MKSILLAALPIAMLLSAIIGGLFYYKRSLAARIQDLAEGCRVIEGMIERTASANAAEAQAHLVIARLHLENAQELRADGEAEAAESELKEGCEELKAARELIQRPEPDEDEDA